MLHSVTLTRFKRFNQTTFDLLLTGIFRGGNDSGKSTLAPSHRSLGILQVNPEERTSGVRGACWPDTRARALGLSADEFSPISAASLKHLWTNLTTQNVGQDGYSLAIECMWRT